jgi:PIN domain nuclease of toxin-antitoxin system
VVVLDTHVAVFDALQPRRLSRKAAKLLDEAEAASDLALSDISLWEIAMLIAKGRLAPGADAEQFLSDIVQARALRVLAITPRIAVLAQSERMVHGDPADRLIAATALAHRAVLVSGDQALARTAGLEVIW